jgi:hypothetical protein
VPASRGVTIDHEVGGPASEEGSMANPHLIIPNGTQVVVRHAVTAGAGEPVCPAGAVGEVVRSPADASHGYRVRSTRS